MQLGYPHPDHLLAHLTSSQLSELMAYAAIEPFGEYRNEIRHGQQMQLLDAAHFSRSKPAKVSDFMNFIDTPAEDLDEEKYFDEIDRDVFGL